MARKPIVSDAIDPFALSSQAPEPPPIKGRYIKGQSGNPSGRPKENPIAKEILRAALPHAAERLVELVDSKNEDTALKAINSLFDRTQGRPMQAVAMDVSGGLDIRAQIRQVLLEKIKEKQGFSDHDNTNGDNTRGFEISN